MKRYQKTTILAMLLMLALALGVGHAEDVVSAPVDLEVGEAEEADLWAEAAADAAEAPADQAVSAAALAEAWTREQFDAWYELRKENGKAADHILGEGGDILNNFQTLVLPGETIAVVPMNAGISDSGMVKYGILNFGFEIYQLDDPEVFTEDSYGKNLLPRTGRPEKTTLSAVETSTFKVPYLARTGIDELEDGSITEVTYVSLYRNDTGLPLFIGGKNGKFAKSESAGKMIGMGGKNGGGASFQGNGTIHSQPTFWFIEPYYIVALNEAPFKQYYEKSFSAMVCDDGKTSWLKTKSPFPIKLLIDGETHTYELPNPLMKGHAFYSWSDNYEYDTGWRWGYLPTRSYTVYEDEAKTYRYEFTYEKTVLTINMRDYIHAQIDTGNGDIAYLHDMLLYPSFDSSSQNTQTIGFDPRGGKVNGQDYYLCNGLGLGDKERELGVNIGKVVPVKSGAKFLGWCADPKNEKGALIKDASIETLAPWVEDGHVELYAVWDGGKADEGKTDDGGSTAEKTSIAKAKVDSIKAQTYTGKRLKPAVKVTLGGKTLKKGTDYTVSYKNNKDVGKATVTIAGKGGYSGSIKKTFKINPQKVSGLKLTAGKKKLTVKWKKAAGGAGYQIQYSLKKNFASAKTVTIAKNKTVNTTLKNLKSGKKYYVRIRGYRKVNGKTYTSAWSKALSKKTK